MTSSKIRAIIIDDEMPARENLRFMLVDHCPEVEIVGMADGVPKGLEVFEETQPELIFLDIRMPSGSEGFELLEKLKDRSFYVVFVTAFKDYAIRAFENRALHYILKPIDETDLIETVRRILDRRSKGEDLAEDFKTYRENLERIEAEINKQVKPKRLTIHHSRGIKIIDPLDIVFLEGSGNCSILHFSKGPEYLDTRTLKVYEALLPDFFFRIHRSYIVNLKEVEEVLHGDDQAVVLKSGAQLPVARDRKKELLELISKV